MGRGPKHGGAHKKTRALLLAARLQQGPPYLCATCHLPLPTDTAKWDLAHREDGKPGYLGFTHHTGKCNRGSPLRYEGRPHPWSRAGRARRASASSEPKSANERIAERERLRLQRVGRRILLPTDVDGVDR